VNRISCVLDATALVDLLVAAQPSECLREAIRYDRCIAPEIVSVDAATLLSRLVDAGALPEIEARQVLHDVHALPLQRLDTGALRVRAWALRTAAGVGGATYISLAEALGVPLLTSDRRLALATGHRAEVRLLNDPD
jgi:predicted nucleic acid-binding protein